MRFLVSLPMLSLLAFPSVAAELSRSANQLEEVVVTASRVARATATIPNTISIIHEDELTEQLAVNHDLSTVLGNLIPSFSPARQKMTSAGESLRGRKPLYMIDGVPQSNPLRNGGRDGHTIDPSAIARVEVVHGANAIQGLGAAGGIINLITKKPGNELQQSFSIDTDFQSGDTSESMTYGGTYGISNKFEQADVLASLSYRDTGMGYDASGNVIGVDNTQGDVMDSAAINLFVKSGYEWSDQRIELMVNHYAVESNHDWVAVAGDVDLDIPSSAVKGPLLGEGAKNKVTALSANYTNEEFFGHSLRIQLFRQDFEATYGAENAPIATFQDPAFGPDLIDQSQNNSEKIGVKVTLVKEQLAGLPIDLVYGVDLLRDETWQALIQTSRSWVPSTNYENVAPFAQLEYTGIENLTLVGGIRYEDSELNVDDFMTLASYGSQSVAGGNPDFTQTLPNVGATYAINENWRVFGNYAEAFSMPDAGRVLRGINQPGQSVETFLDLEPILTENSELGLAYRGDRLGAEFSYYVSDSDFGQRLQRGADGIYTVKREQTEVDGFEFRGSWQASAKDVIALGYASTEGRFDSDADGKVDSDLGGSNIAPDRVNLSWVRDWNAKVNTRLQYNYLMDREFENAAGAVVNDFDGYATVDAIAHVQAFSGQFTLAIQNLTDKSFYTYYSQVNPNDRRNFKGLGRSFALSWRTEI